MVSLSSWRDCPRGCDRWSVISVPAIVWVIVSAAWAARRASAIQCWASSPSRPTVYSVSPRARRRSTRAVASSRWASALPRVAAMSPRARAMFHVVSSGVNRPGVSGDSVPWEGWSYVREYVEEVPGRAA